MTQREFLTSVLTLTNAPMETLEYARASLDKLDEKSHAKSHENELLFTTTILPYLREHNNLTARQIIDNCCFTSVQKLTAIMRPHIGKEITTGRVRNGSSFVITYTAID